MNTNIQKYSFIYSPRTNYNNDKEKENKLFVELVKSFDPYTIKILKKHFKEHLGILNKENFICIIKNHLLSWEPNLPHREKMIIKLLDRLFEEIDINSKGEVEWKNFVNYIINISNVNANENLLYTLQIYSPSKTVINHRSINSENMKYKFISEPDVISFCYYIEKYKLLSIVHEGKSNITFYNIDKKKIEPFEIDIMETQRAINKLEINELYMKAEKNIKKEEEKKNKKLGKFQSKLTAKMTQNNSKEKEKDKEKDKENKQKQRISTPENVKNEIMKINKINLPSPVNNIGNKNKFEKFYPIKICFADEYDIMFISSNNNKISAWKFDNKNYEFKNINYINNNIDKNINTNINNLNAEQNDIQLPLLSCEMPQYAMCYDPGYKVLYTGEEDGKIFKWDFNTNKPIHTFELAKEEKNVYDNIDISNSNKHKKIIELLSLSKADRAILMEKNKKENKNKSIVANNKKEKKSIINIQLNKENKKNTVSCLVLIHNLNLLCSAYYTGQIVLWDIISKIPKKIFSDQKTIINQIIYNPITNRIFTCGFEHEIYIYDPYNGEKAMKKLSGHNASISSISFNKESNELVSNDISGIMKIWDTNNYYNFQSINIREILNLENNKQQKRNNRNNLLNSNYYVEMLSNTKQIILYGKHNLILFEKGKMANPILCDDNIIIGCEYNCYYNNIITSSTKNIKVWNIFNGKIDKIYEDLMDGNEISIFELDKRNKKFYLGDRTGKIKCYNLNNGILLKEFKNHNDTIVNIIHTLKDGSILFTGSADLYIRIHSNIDDKDDIYKEINILNNLLYMNQERNILKKFLFNEIDNMLIMALSSGYIYYYDLNYNKFINETFKKEEKVIKRPSYLSSMTDLPDSKSLFIAHENCEKYILIKANNKYFYYLNGEKLGNFSDDKNKKKSIIYSSIYDQKSERLLLGDHNGTLTCYDMKIVNELMEKNYKDKEEIINIFKKNLIFKKIFIIQIGHNSITHISIPQNLFPKIFIAISSDSIANIYNFENGDYIESLKQISMKYSPVPIAISFLKKNPFGETIEMEEKNKEFDNEYNDYFFIDEETKKRKEKILQTIQEINLNRKNYLIESGSNENNNIDNNNNNSENEGIIYRCEIEPNIKPPHLIYEYAKKSDIVKYSNEIVIYNAKLKLLSQIKGQKVSEDKSSPWNYDVNLEYILRKEKEEQRKLYNKISIKEKDIKISERSFQHLSLINSNYSPTFLTNLKKGEKNNFNEIIKEKLRTINLSKVKKIIVKNEEKEINKYITNHKFPNKNNNNNLTLTKEESDIIERNKIRFKTKLKEEYEKLKEKNLNKIVNRKIYLKSDNKTQEKLVYNTIENSSDINRYNNKINKSGFKDRKSNLAKSLKFLPTTKSDFNDIRFLNCKNEFDEKINEMVNPLKLIFMKNPKLLKLPRLSTNY